MTGLKLIRYCIPLIFYQLFIFSCNSGRNAEKNRVFDVNNNQYQTVIIGTQVWMKENLNVTKYRNGDPVLQANEDSRWESLEEGAFCHYQNNEKNSKIYGKLYNWFAVNDQRGLCPKGWHIPSDEEWQALAEFLGGDKAAGDKMKETGHKHWAEPNTGADNSSGFSALPAGGRDEYGQFIIDKYGGHWWSSTEDGTIDVWVRSIYLNYGSLLRDSYNKKSGFSVRCLKDKTL